MSMTFIITTEQKVIFICIQDIRDDFSGRVLEETPDHLVGDPAVPGGAVVIHVGEADVAEPAGLEDGVAVLVEGLHVDDGVPVVVADVTKTPQGGHHAVLPGDCRSPTQEVFVPGRETFGEARTMAVVLVGG